MFKVAIKSLRSHKLRLVLTMFSIVLGVSFVAGTYIFTDSINNTFTNLFDDVFAGIDVTVRGKEIEDDSFAAPGTSQVPTLDESIVSKIRTIDGVRIASPEVANFVTVIGKDGEALGAGGFGGPPTFAFSWTEFPELNVLLIKEGNGREPTGPGEVVVDVNTAKNEEFVVGDTVRIQANGAVEDFELVGLVSFGEADSLAGATITSYELSEAQRFLDLEGQITGVNIKAVDGVLPEALRDTLVAQLGDGIEAVTGDQQTQENQAEINEGLGFINTALLAFAGVAIFVGAYIIQNTFRIIVAQRSKELALLRAVGATRMQVIRMVLYEAFFVSILASVIGIVVGVFISYAIRNLANSVGLGLADGELTVLPRTIIVAMLVGIIVTMLSALMPAVRASRVTPVEALRDNESSAKQKSLFRRGVVSFVIIMVGTALLIFGLNGDIANPIYYVGGGVFLMFVGVSSFAPILTAPFANTVGWPFAKLRGVSGQIALRNTKRTPRRTASTAAALMIGVSLVALVSIFANSIKATVDETIAETLPSDITFYAPDFVSGVSSDLTSRLREIPEIGVVSRTNYVFGAKIDGLSETGIGIEPDSFNAVVALSVNDNALDRLQGNTVVVRTVFLEEQGWSVGDLVDLQLSLNDTRQVEIIGTFEETFDSTYIFNREIYLEQLDRLPKDTVVYANYADGVSADEGRPLVDELIKEEFPASTAQSASELVEQTKEQIDGLLGLFWGLLGFAIIIAVLGIANTLALSIAERTRELGLLRAVGMTRRQIRTMVRAESVMISLFGATLGVLMGTFFAWAILRALASEGLTAFEIPVGQIIAYFVLAAIAGVFASIWPAYRASKVDILDAIKFE